MLSCLRMQAVNNALKEWLLSCLLTCGNGYATASHILTTLHRRRTLASGLPCHAERVQLKRRSRCSTSRCIRSNDAMLFAISQHCRCAPYRSNVVMSRILRYLRGKHSFFARVLGIRFLRYVPSSDIRVPNTYLYRIISIILIFRRARCTRPKNEFATY